MNLLMNNMLQDVCIEDLDVKGLTIIFICILHRVLFDVGSKSPTKLHTHAYGQTHFITSLLNSQWYSLPTNPSQH